MGKDNREFSLRALDNARKNSVERVNTTPVFMPVGRIRPDTFQDALNRILGHSLVQGLSLDEAYDKIRGEYDENDDFDFSDDDYDDDFEQSSYAEYDDTTDFAAEQSSAEQNIRASLDETGAKNAPVETKERETAEAGSLLKAESARDSEQA